MGVATMSDRVYSEDEVLALARDAYRIGQATFDVIVEKCALVVIDIYRTSSSSRDGRHTGCLQPREWCQTWPI